MLISRKSKPVRESRTDTGPGAVKKDCETEA
jgi:hypothetical protein